MNLAHQLEKYLYILGLNLAGVLLLLWGLDVAGVLYVAPEWFNIALPVGLVLIFVFILKKIIDLGNSRFIYLLARISWRTFTISAPALVILEILSDAHYGPLVPAGPALAAICAYAAFISGAICFTVAQNEVLAAPEDTRTEPLVRIPALYVLAAACAVGLIVKLYIASNMILHIDETYTELVTLGLFKYHTLGVTFSGADYLRTPTFNLLNSIPYFFIHNNLLRLRLFNIVLFTAFQPVFYLLVKKIFSKDVAILFTLLTSTSWYLIANTVAARSYNVLVIFSFLGLIFLYFAFAAIEEQQFKKGLLHFALSVGAGLIVFFEGHSLGFYHLVPYFGAVAVYFVLKSDRMFRYLVFGLGAASAALVALYFVFVAPTFLRYLVSAVYGIQFRSEIMILLASFLSYYALLGAVALGIAAVVSLYSRNSRVLFFSIYCLYVLFIQGYFFGKSSIDVRHFSDILLPIYLILSYYLVYFFRFPRIRLVLIALLTVCICTSARGVYGMATQQIAWAPYYPDNWNASLNDIPDNANIITDSPGIVYFFKRNAKIYTLAGAPTQQIRDENFDTADPLEKHSAGERERFRQFIDSDIRPNYVTVAGQEYYLYTGSPKVMSIDELNQIIRSGPTYLIATHNILDEGSQGYQAKLYDYILDHAQIMQQDFSTTNYFDDQPYPYSYNSRLIVGALPDPSAAFELF